MVRKDKKEMTKITDFQFDLQISYIGPMAIIKLQKSKVLIKWDKKVKS